MGKLIRANFRQVVPSPGPGALGSFFRRVNIANRHIFHFQIGLHQQAIGFVW